MRRLSLRRTLLAAALAATITGGGLTAAPQAANASVTNCWGGRCAIYLSKSETRALAQGSLPAPARGALGAAGAIFILGHRIIAQQYVNRGWCSAILLSPYPWENKGYTGYACNWE